MGNNLLYKPWGTLSNKILAVNCGSSSIKVTLFEYDQGIYHRILDGHLKGLNIEQTILEIASLDKEETLNLSKSLSISKGLKYIFNTLTEKFNFSFTSLLGIGHRFVHGGSHYSSSVRINFPLIAELEKLSDLAPLHNESCLIGIKECFNLATSIPQVAVFDTAFYHSLPVVAAHYAIPNDIAAKYQIKRYGFHGISHAFLWSAYEEYKGKCSQEAKVITLHLGNGCSITANSGGVPIDTSMGFTPAEGLIMATRAGDIDAAIIEFICRHEKKTPGEVMELLNFQSGLLGISGISPNLEILLNIYQKNERAKLAVDMFCYRIVKYIGAYLAALGGAEAIIFSGGIGENSAIIREQVISKIEWYDVKLDNEANQQAVKLYPGNIQKISAPTSKISLYIIASDENFFIAKEVQRMI